MKKTKITVLTLTLTIAAFLCVSGMAYAWHDNQGGSRYPVSQNITPEQYARLEQLKTDHFNAQLPLQQQIRAKQSELRVLYFNNATPDTAKVQALNKEIIDLRAKMYAVNTEFQNKMNAEGYPVGLGWHNNDGGYGNNHNSGHAGGRGGMHGGNHWNY